MTDEALTRERNIFLWGTLGPLLAVAAVLGILSTTSSSQGQPDFMLAVLIAVPALKLAWLYLIFRLSRFLGQRPWMTGLYLVLGFVSGLSLIPFVALLVGVRKARSQAPALGGSPSSAVTVPAVPEAVLPAAQASDPEVCAGCGAPLRADDRFCHSCGEATPAHR